MSNPRKCPKCGAFLPPTAEHCPDCQWAQRILARALERLEQEFTNAGWNTRFRRLKPFLRDAEGGSYSEAAEDLGLTEAVVRTAVHRMRRHFGKQIEEEIKENVGPDVDWRDELQRFLSLL